MPATSCLGYFRYTGEAVANVYLDARTSAEALIGIDEVLRYFLYQKNTALQQIEFEIPVKVQEGSWEALIPGTLSEYLMTALDDRATAYFTAALIKAAEHDVKDKRHKDIVKEAFKAIKWVVRIAAHMKSIFVCKFIQADFHTGANDEIITGIRNGNNQVLYVPPQYLEAYSKCPEKLFARLAKLVKEGRELGIGLNPAQPGDSDDTNETARITAGDRYYFAKREEEEDTVFPGLKHG